MAGNLGPARHVTRCRRVSGDDGGGAAAAADHHQQHGLLRCNRISLLVAHRTLSFVSHYERKGNARERSLTNNLSMPKGFF